ncbi:hypothetical protein L2E82_14366 [Cichorium intybus]|uniref:Uncharacterized protein n=1 Tax=Cichorium intybus TaxID=13427 RepID=A0ACB9EZR4_CICIN|nr:hypothetical protein L2E82_14366 [Cichorium intybus]
MSRDVRYLQAAEEFKRFPASVLPKKLSMVIFVQLVSEIDKGEKSESLFCDKLREGRLVHGTLLDGTPIAVKQLSSKSKQGNREFVNEIGMIAGIQHPNVAVVQTQKGSLLDLVDPRLGSEFNKKEAVGMLKIALLCTNQSPALRPTMSEVVNMLEGRIKIKEPNVNAVMSEEELKFQALGNKFEEMQSHDTESTEISFKPTSSSPNDLYPDSQINV